MACGVANAYKFWKCLMACKIYCPIAYNDLSLIVAYFLDTFEGMEVVADFLSLVRREVM